MCAGDMTLERTYPSSSEDSKGSENGEPSDSSRAGEGNRSGKDQESRGTRGVTGWNSRHTCRDWGAMRAWTAERRYSERGGIL